MCRWGCKLPTIYSRKARRSREELEEYGSIYKMLQEKFHLIPTEADETLEVTFGHPTRGGPAGDPARQSVVVE